MKRLVTSFAAACLLVVIGMRLVPRPTQHHQATHVSPSGTISVSIPSTSAESTKVANAALPEKMAVPEAVVIDMKVISHKDSTPKDSLASGTADKGGRQVVVDADAAAKIEMWLKDGICRLTAVGPNGTGSSGASTEAVTEPSGGASNNQDTPARDEIGIRVETDSPLGSHLSTLIRSGGTPSHATALVVWLPQDRVGEHLSESATLRLICGEDGRPRLIAAVPVITR